MRRSVPVVVIALAALAVSAAGAKKSPPPPEGTWDLSHTRATYSGPPAPVRSAVTKLITRRVVFTPTCTQFQCTVRATVTTPRGRRVAFTLVPVRGRSYSGNAVLPTGLRCGRQKLWAFLTMTATVTQRQEEPGSILTGTTQAAADNPGGCKLFHGKFRAVRNVWFHGVAVTG